MAVHPIRPTPRFHTLCPYCPDVLRDDLLENHLEWVHKQGVSCVTCMDRRVVHDLWAGGDQECPRCGGPNPPETIL